MRTLSMFLAVQANLRDRSPGSEDGPGSGEILRAPAGSCSSGVRQLLWSWPRRRRRPELRDWRGQLCG
eukprot:scaffold825_cov249-Pinguiococcus_pyrenoidosus.AAC.35